MICKIYRCTMSESTCIARQKNAQEGGQCAVGHYRFGANDYNCRDCEQGRNIMEGNSESVKAKVCKRGEACVSGNVPQLLDAGFYRNPGAVDGHDSVCKKCRNKDQSEKKRAARKGYSPAPAERPEKPNISPGPPAKTPALLKVELSANANDRPLPPIEGGPACASHADRPNVLSINFTGREQLLEDLKAKADKDFRTLEQQALFYVFLGVADAAWALPERKAD